MTDFNELVNQEIIMTAKSKLRDVQARRPLAVTAVAVAQSAVAPLRAKLAGALAGDGNDIHTAQAELDAALKQVATAGLMAPAIEAAIVASNDELHVQTGIAHRPMMSAAVLAMAASCATADFHRAGLAQALEDFKLAASAVSHAKANGAGFVGERFDHASPSLTKPNDVFVQPTLSEFVKRLAVPMNYFPGLDVDRKIKS
jgi:hypothetical protein